jgi:hypothetical protein
MVGLALSVLVAVAAWDVGRPGNASPSALLALRAIGGLGLVAMAALALSFGAEQAAGVAAVGAAPLIFGLMRGARAADAEVTVATPAAPPADGAADAPADEQERRAA